MNEDKLYDSIGFLDEDIIDEASKVQSNKKKLILKWGTLAACICIIITITVWIKTFNGKEIVYDNSNNIEGKEDVLVDYSSYFVENYPAAEFSYTLEGGGKAYKFLNFDNKLDLPFKVDELDKEEMDIYCDKEGNPVNGLLRFNNEKENKALYITVSNTGNLYTDCYDLKKVPYTTRDKVKIYGFESGDNTYGKSLQLAFVSQSGIGYTIDGFNLSYNEMGEILEGILNEGIDITSIDLNKADSVTWNDKRDITLEEARKLESFSGHTPKKDFIGNLTLEECAYYVTYKNSDIDFEEMDILYSKEKGEYISAVYTKGIKYNDYNYINIDNFTEDDIEKSGNIYDDQGNYLYNIYLDVGEFQVNISSTAKPDLIWNFIEDIK